MAIGQVWSLGRLDLFYDLQHLNADSLIQQTLQIYPIEHLWNVLDQEVCSARGLPCKDLLLNIMALDPRRN